MSLPLVYSADYVAPLPPEHRFPMPKFQRIYERVIRDGIAGPDQFHVPHTVEREALLLVHESEYVDRFLHGAIDPRAMRRIGFPWSESLSLRTRTAVGGTVLACRLALEHGVACNVAGGTHHAHPGFGSGFCIFNDLAVAAALLRAEGLVQRVLIIDLDVHQGDGTAACFAGDPEIFTFSVHASANFPFRKFAGDLDIGLPENVADGAYLDRLISALLPLLDEFSPDLVIYDGGVDPHIDDLLGKLALSDDGLRMRDTWVLNACRARGIPVATVVGGGYARSVDTLARRHSLLIMAASEISAGARVTRN